MSKKKIIIISGVLIAVVVFCITLLFKFMAGNNDNIVAGQDNSEVQNNKESIESKVITLPYELGDGLIIESAFQFTGINPDCANQEEEDIIAIKLKNTSDSYLEEAQIEMKISEEKEIHFAITNLPAKKSVLAFSSENEVSESEMVITNVICKPTFNEDAMMNDDKIAVSVEGTHVKLKSNVDTELQNIVLYCHAVLENQYFGGITYTYTVDSLPAYESMEVDANECILGLTEVVRIEINGL